MTLNRLLLETSPYLQQHASNPVDWFPWGEEGLARARSEDRPILLSIGYSSCHWCHVMEKESFEDPDVAAVMNQHFISIKVDREERPDLDQVYMKAVQAMTGSGGWPMTVFLTPDGVPYYGGTYFPPISRHGIPSFKQVLQAAADAYRNRKEKILETGSHLIEALTRVSSGSTSGSVSEETQESAYRALSNQYDAVHGGFGRAPKFPQPVTLEFLMRYHVRTGDPAALKMAVHTLSQMAAGGMRDHLAGGFHRYSVDSRWLVPHFEKMLYDNALLTRVYLQAYQITGADEHRLIVEDTLDYLLVDMRTKEGAFSSAHDADSEGEEGLFYLWTAEEIREVLQPDQANLFSRAYDVTTAGNFEGKSILNLPHNLEAVSKAEGIPADELAEMLTKTRSKLLEVRNRREPPFRDDKVIVSWNAMAIRALAEAGAGLGRWDYVESACQAADFLWEKLRINGRLLHTYMAGEAKILAFLDDHAGLGNALLSLHEATLDQQYLEATYWLCEEILERFWDQEIGTVYDTASDAETLVFRPRDPMDNATPSGPSLAAELLTRAGHLFNNDRYSQAAVLILNYEAEALERFGPAFGRMLSVQDRILAKPTEVAIIGKEDDEATQSLIQEAHAGFNRNRTIVGKTTGNKGELVPLLEGRSLIDGAPAAYVCQNYSCLLPATEADSLRSALEELKNS